MKTIKQRFKKQDFQEDAVNSICSVFEGQQYKNSENILLDRISNEGLTKIEGFEKNIFSFHNPKIDLENDEILKNIRGIQKNNNLKQSQSLEGEKLNISVEMETGTGKTFVYIKSIYELNKKYGMNKFIIIVPSIAIREGVYSSLKDLEDYFKLEYSKNINYFIFSPNKESEIKRFSDSKDINIMIINSHSFNKKDKNNIYNQTERKIRLIDYISSTKPIIIIDEPQSVEGKETKKMIKEFNHQIILRFSATFRENEKYNVVYSLDSIDAHKKNLVKKIYIKGLDIDNESNSNTYIYVEGIDLSRSEPTARIEIEIRQKEKIVKKVRRVKEGDDLYIISEELEQYKNYKILEIDGYNKIIKFNTGVKIKSGEIVGGLDEKHKRRIQIRETIKSHLEKEEMNFKNGIKVLSLFFIDEVKKYRDYNVETNEKEKGEYAKIFEEEYKNIINFYYKENQNKEFFNYINKNEVENIHEGYFSIDKKGNFTNSNSKTKSELKNSSDTNAYDLIMKNKGILLNMNNEVRFIFSHSALKEGWDNPNVFQICVLRNTDPREIKSKQEIGRGLRLCVNQLGERIDKDYEDLNSDEINKLTIIANESFENFANNLQNELNENLRLRDRKLTIEFLVKKKIDEKKINDNLANKICRDFIRREYVDDNDEISNKFKEDLEKNKIEFNEELNDFKEEIIEIVKELYEYDVKDLINKGNRDKFENKIKKHFYESSQLEDLWKHIETKTFYKINLDEKSLIDEIINKINQDLNVLKTKIIVKEGVIKTEESNFEIQLEKEKIPEEIRDINLNIKFDLIGEISRKTILKRETIVKILSNVTEEKFNEFKKNPNDFILKIINIIEEVKRKNSHKNIEYEIIKNEVIKKEELKELEEGRGNFSIEPDKLNKYLLDYTFYDSIAEKNFSNKLDKFEGLYFFSKLPKNKYIIKTPVGKYSPDWLIILNKEFTREIFFIFEIKGSEKNENLKRIEEIKISCAEEHFKLISNDKVKFFCYR